MTSTTPRKSNSSDVLERAIAAIEEHGWCQGTLSKRDGRMCLIGALCFAAYGDDGCELRDTKTIARALGLVAGAIGARQSGVPDSVHIARWSDSVGRSKEEVLDALRRALAQARSDDELWYVLAQARLGDG